jgi:hypothetical protein
MRKLWTAQEIEWLKANYPDTPTHKICEHLGRSKESVFGRVYTLGLTKSEAFRNSPLSGRMMPGATLGGGTRFKKGQAPANKGKKQHEYMSAEGIERTKASRFKKGSVPHNTNQQGNGAITIRRDKNGNRYQYIRIALGHWRELHRVVWEQHHGPQPKGFNVQFRDKNPLNCTIENLYLVSRKKQMIDNSIMRYPPEIKKTIRVLGKLKRKIRHYEKQD